MGEEEDSLTNIFHFDDFVSGFAMRSRHFDFFIDGLATIARAKGKSRKFSDALNPLRLHRRS